jgi:lysophospholipase L1-like esterase
MAVDPRLSRLIALALSPVLMVQARHLRHVIPILPEADTPWDGAIDGPDPVRILVLGDSTAAGVGVTSQLDALPGNIARAIRDHWERGSMWSAVGKNGGTAHDIVENYLDEACSAEYDLIFLSIGANDVLGARSRGAFRRDVRTILRRLRSANPSALILMSSLPAFFRFEGMPNPLRWVLYLHSQSLESAARKFVRGEPGVIMSTPPPPYTVGFFARDRFHPSATGYRDWVDFMLTDSKLVPVAEAEAIAEGDEVGAA